MFRLIIFFAAIVLSTMFFSWLSGMEGEIKFENIGQIKAQDGTVIQEGKNFGFNVLAMVIALLAVVFTLVLAWTIIKGFFTAPGNIARSIRTRRETKGFAALNEGIIAVNAGDSKMAGKLAKKAGKALANQPMSALLKAQAAHLSGNRAAARRIYESMLLSPDTEVMGLRGLYDEARKENELIAAKQFAEKALGINKNLGWAIKGLLELQSRSGEWHKARQTLKLARLDGLMDKKKVNRLRAVLLAAESMELEVHDMDTALKYALESHKLARDLIPAAEIAGRILASRGHAGRAAKIVARTWDHTPHPDLAQIYAHARTGDSYRDKIGRLKTLNKAAPGIIESAIAIAGIAVEAKDWNEARRALKPLLDKDPSGRICTLMARIEGGEFGDKGRVREWLARAVNAPADPAWIADGFISGHWLPVSPVSGELDRFTWSTPPQSPDIHSQLGHEEFIAVTASQLKGTAPVNKADNAEDTGGQAARLAPGKSGNKQTGSSEKKPGQEVTDKKAVSDAVVIKEETKKEANGQKKPATKAPAAKPRVTRDNSHPRPSGDSQKQGTDQKKTGTITVAAKPAGTDKSTNKAKQKFVSSQRAPDDPGPENDAAY